MPDETPPQRTAGVDFWAEMLLGSPEDYGEICELLSASGDNRWVGFDWGYDTATVNEIPPDMRQAVAERFNEKLVERCGDSSTP